MNFIAWLANKLSIICIRIAHLPDGNGFEQLLKLFIVQSAIFVHLSVHVTVHVSNQRFESAHNHNNNNYNSITRKFGGLASIGLVPRPLLNQYCMLKSCEAWDYNNYM